MKFRNLPLILSAVLIAAHFLRSYSFVPMILCIVSPFLLLIKKRWSLVFLQSLTVVSAMIWLAALYSIIQERMMMGRSWLASAIILGGVAIFALYSGWLLDAPPASDKTFS
jgi:hypothetical protein